MILSTLISPSSPSINIFEGLQITSLAENDIASPGFMVTGLFFLNEQPPRSQLIENVMFASVVASETGITRATSVASSFFLPMARGVRICIVNEVTSLLCILSTGSFQFPSD